MEIENILQERGKEYGDFRTQASISQELKQILEKHWQNNNIGMIPYQREALTMILHKISRIINGNPDNIDSWTDICGYSQLVVNELQKGK